MAGDLIAALDAAAAALTRRLLAAPGARLLPTTDWQAEAAAAGTLRRALDWRNTEIRSDAWSRAHVQFFSIPGEIAVLHLCAFPALDRALPIFGFDMVTGQAKATGCFLDLSPTVPDAAPLIADWAAALAPGRAALGEARPLPDWADMFSAEAVAVRPRDAAEVAAGLAAGAATLDHLLALPAPPRADPAAMHAAQARYIAAQRRNDRTRRMLAACIGAPLTERFISACLFADPPAPVAALA